MGPNWALRSNTSGTSPAVHSISDSMGIYSLDEVGEMIGMLGSMMSASNVRTIGQVGDCRAWRARRDIFIVYTNFSRRVYFRKMNNKTPFRRWVKGTAPNFETNETSFGRGS